jgi:hypothetical protein
VALDRLIRDEVLRRELGRHARESVRRFDPELVLDRWEHLFSLLHPRSGAERAPAVAPSHAVLPHSAAAGEPSLG